VSHSDKPIAVEPSPQAAEPIDRPAEASHQGRTPSTAESPAPTLDRLVDELETAFGDALSNGLSTPAASRPSLPPSGASGVGDEPARAPDQEESGTGTHPADRSFEGVLNGEAWAVRLPASEAVAGAQAPDLQAAGLVESEPVDRPESVPPPPRAGVLWSPQWVGSRPRQAAIAGAILIPLVIGGVSLAYMGPGSAPATIEAEDVASGESTPASIGAEARGDLGRVTIDDSFVQDARLAEPQEPITPRLVRTVRIYDGSDEPAVLPPPELPALRQLGHAAPQPDEASEATGRQSMEAQAWPEASGAQWSEGAAANAGLADRLQAGERLPALPDEAMSGTEPHATEPNRWPTRMDVEDDAGPQDMVAATDQAEDAVAPDNPAEPAAELTGTALDAEQAAPEADVSPAPAAEPPAEPTRFAAASADVNMRRGPSSRAAVVTVVPAGGRLGVIDCAAWCEVVFRGQHGWVHSSFVGGGTAERAAGAAASADLRIAAGTPLVSADGARLGVVRSETTGDDGQVFYLIELAQELGTGAKSMWLRKEHFVSAGDEARVSFTRARLLRSLPSQSEAEASRGAGAG
jgi:uncharacterized protein YraI